MNLLTQMRFCFIAILQAFFCCVNAYILYLYLSFSDACYGWFGSNSQAKDHGLRRLADRGFDGKCETP